MPISTKTKKRVWGRAGACCSICERMLVEPIKGSDPVSIGKWIEIRSQDNAHPRFDESLTLHQSDLDANIILLCGEHAQTHLSALELEAHKIAHEDRIQASLRDHFPIGSIETLLNPVKTRVPAKLDRYFSDVSTLIEFTNSEFEALITDLLIKDGYELAPPHEGRIEVLATRTEPDGTKRIVFVQCKHYTLDRPINLQEAKEFHDYLMVYGATDGLFPTTSRFVKGVRDWARVEHSPLRLVDRAGLLAWFESAKR